MKKTDILYILIILLLIAFPFLKNIDILLNPATTIAVNEDINDVMITESFKTDYFKKINYNVNGTVYQLWVPFEYAMEYNIEIMYNKKNPKEAIVNKLSYLYFAPYMIFPVFFFILISAYYIQQRFKKR